MTSDVRRLSTRFGLLVVLLAMGGGPALAQSQPFIFTVTTLAPEGQHERWNLRYDAGYGNRATDPFGFDGMEQGVTFQGALRHGFTVRGQVGLGLDSQSTSTSQNVEILKDLRSSSHAIALSVGLGMRREWEGTGVMTGRVAVGHTFQTSWLYGNVSFERPFEEGRDGLDLITSIGWLRQIGSAVHVGAEAVAEDIEGFWEPNEAEGGAKIFVGPSIHIAVPTRSWAVSLSAGPIFYPTRTGRTSQAVRPLEASGNGFTARLFVGYSF